MKPARFCTWMVFSLLIAVPAIVGTVGATGAMLLVGLWQPTVPLAWKLATPLGFVLLWLEFYVSALVLDWSAQ